MLLPQFYIYYVVLFYRIVRMQSLIPSQLILKRSKNGLAHKTPRATLLASDANEMPPTECFQSANANTTNISALNPDKSPTCSELLNRNDKSELLKLIPSQMLLKRNKFPASKISHDDVTSISKTKKPNKSEEVLHKSDKIALSSSTQLNFTSPKQRGKFANIFWRSIAIDDLRAHPYFEALPNPSSVHAQTPKSFASFRQDSWQWDALHQGRLTTSKAAACLGFYELSPARLLNVPRSLSSHSRAIGAWQQLLLSPPRDWAFLNRDFTAGNCSSANISRRKEFIAEPVWLKRNPKSKLTFPFEYHPKPTIISRSQQRGYSTASSARLAWGSIQEATAILAAVNYFHNTSRGTAKVSEVGMLALEAIDDLPQEISSWCSDGTLPLIGASPDGIIKYEDGTVDVLEIKCSSPFVSVAATRKRNETISTHRGAECSQLKVSMQPPHEGIGSWHVAQLQLEILCAGPQCRGAVMLSLSAGNGAVLYRMERNDEYILQMLKWLREFYIRYLHPREPAERPSSQSDKRVKENNQMQASKDKYKSTTSTTKQTHLDTPPEDFFLRAHNRVGEKSGRDGDRMGSNNDREKRLDNSPAAYKEFLAHTVDIARGAQLMARLSQAEVQRSPINTQLFL